jgi:cytochrome b pre-mRNA-processing protein 3
VNPLNPRARQHDPARAAKLYGAIVARARLPTFYRAFGVSDTLDGRFLLLSLHLFAVLQRLRQEGEAAGGLAQDLSDRFSDDMETVLREIGVGDLRIPKQMRRLVASSQALFQAYEKAAALGEEAIAAAIAEAFGLSADATRRLAHYVMGMLCTLETQPVAALLRGEVRFPSPGPEDLPGETR